MIRKIKYAFMLLLALAQGVDSMADVVLTVKNSGQEQRRITGGLSDHTRQQTTCRDYRHTRRYSQVLCQTGHT